MTITPDDLVRREVCHTCSYLVSTLAAGFGAQIATGSAESRHNLEVLCEQAYELAAPIDDWEEAAIQAGFIRYAPGQQVTPPDADQEWWYLESDPSGDWFNTAEDACRNSNGATDADFIEPYQREVYEHWIITDWLADKLEAHGEKVDRDFAGLTVWARTTTGQAIASDYVIEAITAEVNAGV
jgi:hypothetical protein